MKRSKCVRCVFWISYLFAVPSFVLQTTGMFTPNWVSNKTNLNCDIGLVYSCCNGTCRNTNGSHELNASALGFHATSLAFFMCAMIVNVYVLCTTKCYNEFWMGVFFIATACADVCCFIGTVIVYRAAWPNLIGTENFSLKYSFCLCMVACCWTFLYVSLSGGFYFYNKWYECLKGWSDGNSSTRAVSHNINPTSTIPYRNITTCAVYSNGNTRGAKISRVQPFDNSKDVSNEQISGGKGVLSKTHIHCRGNAPSTKSFGDNSRNSVEPFTGRDNTFSTERYIFNGSDSVGPLNENGSDFAAVKPFASDRGYISSKLQSNKNGIQNKEVNDDVLSVKQYVGGRRLGHS